MGVGEVALIPFTDRNSAGGALGGGDGWRKRPSLAGKIWVERGFCCPVGELDEMDATRKSGLQKRLFCFPVKRRLALGAQAGSSPASGHTRWGVGKVARCRAVAPRPATRAPLRDSLCGAHGFAATDVPPGKVCSARAAGFIMIDVPAAWGA